MKLPQWFNRAGILDPCRRTAFAAALLLGIEMSVVTVVLGAGNSNGNSFGISGNTPGFVAKATDLGPVDPNTLIAVTVWLKLHAQADGVVKASGK
jgi:hypothetical protein